MPEHFLNPFLVTAGELQTSPGQRGTQMRAHARQQAKAGERLHRRRHRGRRLAPACDQQRSFAEAAGCRCRPHGAGVQQNISKRVWARFRSVRQSLWPTLPADPFFRRVSGSVRQRHLAHVFWVHPGKFVRAELPSPWSRPHFGPAEPDICSRGPGC